MKNFRSHYPFTLPGTAAVLTVLFSFGKGYSDSDYQSIFISLIFFIILLILVSAAYYSALRFRLNDFKIKSKGEISSSEPGRNEQIVKFEEAPPAFFRYAYSLKGKYLAADMSCRFYNRFNSDRNGIIKFSYMFNSPGTLDVNRECFLEDIFGLIRIPCSEIENTVVRIVPGPPEKAYRNSRDSMSSLVKNKKPDENDYEKILMREYMRGDRSRDINWKASSKSNTIYTRIAPGNDNEIKKINIVYAADPELFKNDIYSGFLIHRFFREYFRFFINDLFNIENYKFNIFINALKISADNRNTLDSVYRELSKPEIGNDFEKTIHDNDTEGSFIIFCENRNKIEDLKPVFINASGVRYFYPELIKKDSSENKSYADSGYIIEAVDFDNPGKGIIPGSDFFKSMRNFRKKNKPFQNTGSDPESRAVNIII